MSRGALITAKATTALQEINEDGTRLGFARDYVAQAYMGRWGGQATVEKVRRRVHWIAAEARGSRVLDVGTSEGIVPILLGREGFHVVGIDISAEAIDYANQLLEQEPEVVRERISFRPISLFQQEDTPQFDTVIMGEVIEHVSNVESFVSRALQTLAPGGRLILTTPFGVHPDRDHKHSFFISDMQALFAPRGRIESLTVVDGYIRLLFRNEEPAAAQEQLPALALPDVLALTEEATFASQSLLWRQIDQAGQRIEALQAQMKAAQQQAAQSDAARREQETALQDAGRELADLQERLRSADAAVEARKGELAEQRAALEERDAEARRAGAEAAEWQARCDALQQELRHLETDLVRAREQQTTSQEALAARDAAVQALEAAQAQRETELAAARDEAAVAAERLAERERELAELKATLAEQQETLTAAQARCDELSAKVAELSDALAAAQAETAALREREAAFEARLAAGDARATELQQSLDQVQQQRESEREALRAAERQRRSVLEEWEEAQAETRAAQDQLAEAERRLAERTQQLAEQEAILTEWAEECERLEAERRAAEARAAQHEQRLAEAEARHAEAQERLEAREAQAGEQTAELEGLRRQVVERDAEVRDLSQALAAAEAAGRDLAQTQARLAKAEAEKQETARRLQEQQGLAAQRAQELDGLRKQLSDLEAKAKSQAEALSRAQAAERAAAERLAEREKALSAAEARLAEQNKALDGRARELESAQAARARLESEADGLRTRLEATTRQQRETARELASLKTQAAQQLTVLEGAERLRWVEPLLELFRRLELEPRKLANLGTELAKERYRDDPFAMLLLASLADALDPQPARRKWLGFRLLKADLPDATERVLAPLQGMFPFSTSEQKAWEEFVEQRRREQQARRKLIQVSYETATEWFYREGKLTDTLYALENLQENNVKFDKSKRDFKAFVEGLVRLKGGWSLPPRQPNAGLMPRRRHLLYCLHQSLPYVTNGYATRSHGIAAGLQQGGFKVRATTRPGFPWDGGTKGLSKSYHEAEVDGVTYAACAGWNLNKTPLDYYFAEAADHYLREAQTSGAEIIVAASNHITALPALTAARRLGLPFVYEVRGLWEVTQASSQPEWVGSERYQLMRKLEQQAAREADLVITLTEELADELASWGVPRERIEVVPNAVNAERFKPMATDTAIARELNLKPGVPVIGYAGSAVAYEGLILLIEALATLKKNGQAFIFVLVGDGKVIDSVKAKAKELGIEEECRFTGRVPFEQVPRYLSCMDILPIPRLSSPVTEMVSALKPLEAMAMGKALVLSDVSPHTTMAGPNRERARLFKKDSAQALSDALQALIDSPEERKRLGAAARAWIEQRRTWNHVTRRYADALQRMRRNMAAEGAKPPAGARRLEQITLGLIADRFTTDTLASAVKVVPLSPENWREELAKQPIDAMFVESAWKGNDGQWHKKVGYYGDEEFAPLSELLTHCREQGIPSLFWNKEDPIHFERFRKTASLCDHVFTTDSRRIIPYLATTGALSQTASSCPFYASPKIHNLLPSTREWQATAAYGGTYYGKRYPDRTEYLDKIMSAAAPLGLTIYDRQHDDPGSPYKYPGPLGGYVAGSLSYEEMIQAYKAHPVQINVNSVLDSPTMFSRRVVETSACGSPLISGPALGMNRYMEGAGHIVCTESEAAQALENLLHHPAYRWRVALKAARAIMRAHTTQHRLVQMLRTAGLAMLAPEPPAITLLTEEVTGAAAEQILSQTLRPQRVLAHKWQANTQSQLEAAGIQCESARAQSAEANSLWLLASPGALADLEPEDLEDLAWLTVYAPQARIGFSRSSELAEGDWPGVALDNYPIDAGLQLLRPSATLPVSELAGWGAQQPALALRKPPQVHEQPPNVEPKKTLVIAGHDLKFIKPFYPYFTKAGIRLLLDFWTGHNQHNELVSKRLVSQADTVFCEWMLGNAIWYAKNKRVGQKLVGRLHAQEMRSPLFDIVPFEAFDTVIFVGPHMLRNAQKRNPVLNRNGVVIYNGVDIEALQAVPRKPTNGKVLGLVGLVPQSKRLDRALDILKELRREDDGYILRAKGKRPEEYAWMVSDRPEEMAWYDAQYRRLKEDPNLKGAVIFDAHGNDMPEWYAGIDYILSVSDHESFHLAIAEGAAAGCTPISLPWEGADEIYPKEWVYPDAKAAAKGIKSGPEGQTSYMNIVQHKFDIKVVGNKTINVC